MEREKLILTKEEAKDIIYGDNEEFDTVINSVIDTTSWSIINEIIIKRKSDGKFFKDYYSEGASESQDEGPYDYTVPNFYEVYPVEKTITVYEYLNNHRSCCREHNAAR